MKLPELITILRNAKEYSDINKYKDEIVELIPKTEIMVDYNQRNKAHQYDLWQHCCETVLNLPKDIDDDMVYLAAFLHDIGKPDCQIVDVKNGEENYHYYGHPARSREIVEQEIIPGLIEKGEQLSETEKRLLLYYVEFHDDRVSLRMKHLRRHLRMGYTLQEFQNLMLLQVADAKAHILIPIIEQRIEICSQLAGEYGKELYQKLLDEGKD